LFANEYRYDTLSNQWYYRDNNQCLPPLSSSTSISSTTSPISSVASVDTSTSVVPLPWRHHQNGSPLSICEWKANDDHPVLVLLGGRTMVKSNGNPAAAAAAGICY
jgi:hypothetical protein